MYQTIRNLKSKDPKVRAKSAETLGEMQAKPAVPTLIQLLDDDNNDVRENSAWALGEIGDKRSAKALIKALNDKDPDVKEIVIESLGKIGDKIAVLPLIQILTYDENSTLREYAAWALGEIRDEKSVKPLIKALKDKDSDVRDEVEKALEKMSNTCSKCGSKNYIDIKFCKKCGLSLNYNVIEILGIDETNTIFEDNYCLELSKEEIKEFAFRFNSIDYLFEETGLVLISKERKFFKIPYKEIRKVKLYLQKKSIIKIYTLKGLLILTTGKAEKADSFIDLFEIASIKADDDIIFEETILPKGGGPIIGAGVLIPLG